VRIADLPIPPSLKEYYVGAGITDLYPPQVACIERGVLSGKNLLIAIPTASGKTLVAEMAMHHHAAQGGRCLYIVPLKALASEKFDEFGGKGLKVGIATGDYDRRDEFLGRNDIIVATSEKVDSLVRNRAPWLGSITLLVIDEVHLLDDADRGPTLEMVITKLRYLNPGMQVIGLSATIGNPEILAAWLDGEAVTSSWRPVELREGIYHRGRIIFPSSERVVPPVSKFDDLNLVMDIVAEGGQCLVFVNSRRNAEAFARRAGGAFGVGSDRCMELSLRLQSMAETEGERELALCIARGAAFHHAGLKKGVRSLVEGGFREGAIRCIASTPTLAAGLNLPARRVIVRDYHRYEAGEGMVPLPAREYHQMAGRAGRPRLDPYGEAILIAKERGDIERLSEWYINAPPEGVHSRCATVWALCAHILSLIATGFAQRRQKLEAFLERTYYHHERGDSAVMGSVLTRSISYLTDAEMVVTLGDRYTATEYGILVSRLYLDPRSAQIITSALAAAPDFSDVAFLQVVCSTPDMPTLSVRRNDGALLDRLIKRSGDELWCEVPFLGEAEMESFYRSLKTAVLLDEWANEVSEAVICEHFGIGGGDLYTMVESINWLLHAGGRLSAMFSPQFSSPLAALELRVRHGIKPELLPLIRLRGIGRVRARRLFNNGMTDPASLLAAGRERIVPILGAGITEQVFTQLESKAPAQGLEGTDLQSSLGEFP